jgi:hypothetical protein
MAPLTELWVPILLSAVIVFVASSIVHMVLPFHRGDFRPMPSESEVMESLRRFNIPPGDYMFPRPESVAAMKSPEFQEKRNKGPVAVMTVMPSGPSSMGVPLAQWFLFSAVVSLFAGYVASRALGPGAPYIEVFRFAGTVAFAGYSLALWPMVIWYKRSLRTTILSTIDGLVYALLTAGVFGWLWPR